MHKLNDRGDKMAENAKNPGIEKNLKLQTYVGAEDKEKYLFLKARLAAGADIPDSQALKLIINRLHALETNTSVFDASDLLNYTRHIERRLRAVEKELRSLQEARGSTVNTQRPSPRPDNDAD
jgi:hypothetical protein